MIIQQVINGVRKGQQIFIIGNEKVGTLLPICNSLNDRPLIISPTVFWVKNVGSVQWMVIE